MTTDSNYLVVFYPNEVKVLDFELKKFQDLSKKHTAVLVNNGDGIFNIRDHREEGHDVDIEGIMEPEELFKELARCVVAYKKQFKGYKFYDHLEEYKDSDETYTFEDERSIQPDETVDYVDDDSSTIYDESNVVDDSDDSAVDDQDDKYVILPVDEDHADSIPEDVWNPKDHKACITLMPSDEQLKFQSWLECYTDFQQMKLVLKKIAAQLSIESAL